jgi:hypothetical protein
MENRNTRWIASLHPLHALAFILAIGASLNVGAQTATLITDHAHYLPGEPITATFRGGPGNPKDWVGVYPEGVEPGSVGSTIWLYTDGTTAGTKGLTEGTVTFANGLGLGGEWVAYLLLNDGYNQLASTKLTVIDPSQPYVRSEKRIYAANEPISVAFTNGPANPKDWVGIYPADRQPGNGQSLLWFYVDGTRAGTTGQSEGVIAFPTGLAAAGEYVAYLLANDGYDVLASEPLSIAAPAGAGPRVLSISPVANASNVPPVLEFTASLTNGVAPIATNAISLKIDDQTVAPVITFQSGLVTVAYTNSTMFASGSAHSYELIYADTATPANRATNQASFTVMTYTNLVLPTPLYFENFDSTPEGQLPPGWTATSFSAVNDENSDLQDLNSKAYANWLVVSRDRFTQPFLSYDSHEPTTDYERVLSVNPRIVVNGQVVRDLISGRFAFANSGYRSGGNQYMVLFTPDFDLRGKTNVHLAYHSIWEQNQDSMAAVEYSIDGGQNWLPVVYMIDQADVLTTAEGAIDAVATFTEERGDAARYTDPATGEEKGGVYGAFIAAAITADLAPYISARVNDDPLESKRVELFRLPRADDQARVRFRFAHAGTDSWYFGIDNFGLYALGGAAPSTPSLRIARSANQLVITWPAGLDGYNLESTDSLQSPNWRAVTGVAGNAATVPISGKQQFYRLRK